MADLAGDACVFFRPRRSLDLREARRTDCSMRLVCSDTTGWTLQHDTFDQVALANSRASRVIMPPRRAFGSAAAAPARCRITLPSRCSSARGNWTAPAGRPVARLQTCVCLRVGGQLGGASTHTLSRPSPLQAAASMRARVGGGCPVRDPESRMEERAREVQSCRSSPGSSSSGYPIVTRCCPHRVGTRATCRFTESRSVRSSAPCLATRRTLGDPPREGREPRTDRGIFRPSEPTPRVGCYRGCDRGCPRLARRWCRWRLVPPRGAFRSPIAGA